MQHDTIRYNDIHIGVCISLYIERDTYIHIFTYIHTDHLVTVLLIMMIVRSRVSKQVVTSDTLEPYSRNRTNSIIGYHAARYITIQ